MATKEISGLTDLAAQPADGDYIPLRDVSAAADRRSNASYFARTTDGLTVLFTGGGTGVTLAATQSLSNKTLVTPTIASFVNATHNHTTNATGGTLAAYATLSGAETLANKTLTTPTIASFANAAHDHADAAGGGNLGNITTGTITSGDITSSGAINASEVNVSGVVDLQSGAMTIYGDLIFDDGAGPAPASSSATGTKGTFRADANYLYYCYDNNAWVRDAWEAW